MCIDVVDVLRIDVPVLHREPHAALRAVAIFGREGDVVGVGVHAKPGELCIDGGAARHRVGSLLQDEYPGAFAEDEPIALLVPRSTGPFRLIVSRGERSSGCEATEAGRGSCHFGPSGDHHVSVAAFNHSRRAADVVGTGRAGGHDAVVGAFDAVPDAEIARDHVDDVGRHEEGGNLSRSGFHEGRVTLLNARQPSDSRADRHTDALRVLFGYLDPGVRDRLNTSRDPEVDERIGLTGFLGRQVRRQIEIPNFPCDLTREGTRIEAGNRPDPAAAVDDR